MIIERDNRFYRLIPNPELNGMCDGYEDITEELKDSTCIDCPCRSRCEYAFDPYCVDGECLSTK